MLRYLIVLLPVLLSSCSSLDDIYAKKAICRDLRSQIVLNAATSDTRLANIDRAQMPLQEQTYDMNRCGDQ